jgi:ComF family protein
MPCPPATGPEEPRAAFEYGGPVQEAIVRLKYGGRSDLGAPLGGLVARAAVGSAADLVVPVPLHPVRLSERGFNHAALLAGPVARALGVPLRASVLRRQARAAQASLGRDERLANVRGAFTARCRIDGAAVMLVDDVITTGATSAACTEALLGAGARSVTVVALARAGRGVCP